MSAEMTDTELERYLFFMSRPQYREWNNEMAKSLNKLGLQKKVGVAYDHLEVEVSKAVGDNDHEPLAVGVIFNDEGQVDIDVLENWPALDSLPAHDSAYALAYVITTCQVLTSGSLIKADTLFNHNFNKCLIDSGENNAPDQGDGK